MIPYSREVFFSFLADYNTAIWPAQAVALLLGVMAVFLSFKATGYNGRIVSAIVAAAWIWTGAIYHLTFFVSISFWDRGFGTLFILQGLLIIWSGLYGGHLRFDAKAREFTGRAGLAIVVLALVAYPLLSGVIGHGWSEIAWFGVSPTATVIFTLGLLLMTGQGRRTHLLVIPLLCSATGFALALLLPIPQDWMLLPVGLTATVLTFRRTSRSDL
jgi:hypothetical protein